MAGARRGVRKLSQGHEYEYRYRARSEATHPTITTAIMPVAMLMGSERSNIVE